MTYPKSIVFATLTALTLVLPAWAQSPTVQHGEAIHHDTSPPMSEMPVTAAVVTGESKEVPIRQKPDFARDPANAAPDGGLQNQSIARAAQLAPTPVVSLSVSGLSEQDNVDTVGVAIVPPDTNGDIGLDENGNRIYIQYINLVWGVFDVTGSLIAGPFAGNSFWTGFGGPCEDNNDGDPVVLYDDQAGRWFFSQFSINEGVQCVAISTTSDPLGPYHRYAFLVTPGGANDYPKLGVWDDGGGGQSAYTFTTRDFGGAGGSFSVGAGVMERDKMLLGQPAQLIKFSNPCVAGDCLEGQLPQHLAGPPPPAGTCPTYWTAVDAAYDDSPFANDGYRNHTLCVDWGNIGSSTYTEGPLVVAGSNFDRFLGNGFSDCISPVNGGEALDCLAAFTMYRAQYRWFGDNARVVLNTTVDADGTDRAGIRWAETRSADGDSGWTLQQDGTYAPDDGLERWMGSIAQDQDGNIALGYSATGADLFPTVRYTSRMAGDPAGTMPGGEVSCHEGTGAQIGSANRWGDYSSMSIDPTDECTFWYTQEYYQTTGSFDFNTRICRFAFPDCGGACVPDETPEATCNDGLDNDCDGDFDCFDSDCDLDPACACVPEPEICDDGIDNDCDGLVDCDDDDCNLDPACQAAANDLCEDAIEIECGDTLSGSTTDATVDGADFCGTSVTAPGVWYKVTHTGLVTASTCNQANFDTKLSVYDGGCDGLDCVTGNDDTAGCSGFTTEVQWAADGTEDLILVHGFSSATGDFDLTVSCADPVEGDMCEDAVGPLAVDSVTPGTTTGATLDEPPDIDCGTSVTAPGVWYTVEGTGNTMTASTCNDGDPATGGADYDTKISVYCADCETKECIGGQDDDLANCSGFSTKFDWPTQAGATYNVLVHGFGTATGDFDLAILDDGLPVEPGVANDCDGIPEEFDFCPGTVIPESVPTSGRLRANNSAVTDTSGFFTTAGPNPQELLFSLEDTAGCSCEQIVDAQHLGQGHLQNGCSPGAMQNWLDFLQGQSCGDCVEAHATPGCENGDCEAAVCAVDPFCCNVFWDGLCVNQALDICGDGDICIALPPSADSEMLYGEGRGPAAEPISKDPNYVPKE